ncbi:MAG: hypothetical protein IT281_06390 [Ignavibacteria bacterium]|nr:hypothetical protein [Ignavibacteria bacterium]MCC7159146.1 hypothetical protein [Ignavibacteria bacterium]
MKYLKTIMPILCTGLLFCFYSCSNESPVGTSADETILFEMHGLVDSAVVTGCYAYTHRYFVPDTLSLSSYSKIKVEFDGFSTSDHSTISFLYNSIDSTNVEVFSVMNSDLNGYHSFSFDKPANVIWAELRLYLNPQVCGVNEFKYTRARDLKIIGIK